MKISPQTVNRLADFAKPAVAAGVIAAAELKAAIKILRGYAIGNPQQKPRPDMLTMAETAERFKCSKKTVSRMVMDGTITPRYLRPGCAKSLRFAESEIVALIEGGHDND